MATNLVLHDESDHVSIFPFPQTPSTTDYTITVWTRPVGGSSNTIIGNGSGNDIQLNSDKFTYHSIKGGTKGTVLLTDTNAAITGGWRFVAVRAAGSLVEMFVDNVLAASGNYDGSSPAGATTVRITNIGRNSTVGTSYYKGHIRGVGLYERALSNAELSTIYNGGVYVDNANGVTSGMTAGWNFTNGSGATAPSIVGEEADLNNPNGVYSQWLDGDRQTNRTHYVTPSGSFANDGSSFSNAWSFSYAMRGAPEILPGDTVLIQDNSTFTGGFTSNLQGTATQPITVRGETINQYPPKITLDCETSNQICFRIYGGYTKYWDFEITDSNVDKISNESGSFPTDINQNEGVALLGKEVTCYNFVIHDMGSNGVSGFNPSGNVYHKNFVIFNNGWTSTVDGDHGHGIYVHNEKSASNTLFENTSSTQAFGYTMQHYGSVNNVESLNYTFDWFISIEGRGFAVVGNYQKRNFFINSLINNTDFLLGQLGEVNFNTTVTNSITKKITITKWNDISFNNNTVIGGASLVLDMRNYTGNMNDYPFDNNQYYTTLASPFRLRDSAGANPVDYNLSGWQGLAATLDPNSSLTAAAEPAANLIRYKSDNLTRRGWFVVYNFEDLASVNIDLSQLNLPDGMGYKIYQLQNPLTVFQSGTYDAQNPTIAVSMTSNGVAADPVGVTRAEPRPARLPDLGAFMVVPDSYNPLIGTVYDWLR